MLGKWEFKTASKPVKPEPMEPGLAQEWLNFVLLAPTFIPEGTTLQEPGTLRKEVPPCTGGKVKEYPDWTEAKTCSYIWTVTGPKRQLRIKQFLYDFAPPACDHPGLSGNPDLPFAIDDWRIGWLGTDYKGKRGGAATLWGTMCELSVSKGEFSDDELIKIFQGLKPVSALAAMFVLETPFAFLSYWARYKCKLTSRPSSLWKYERMNLDASYLWQAAAGAPANSKELIFVPRAGSGWELDSWCVYNADQADAREVEALYKLGTRDRYLYIRVLPFVEEGGALTIPPKPSGHPCRTESRMVEGHRVWHAWIDERFGPHDAVFNTDNHVVLVQTNSCAGGSLASFQNLLEKILSG